MSGSSSISIDDEGEEMDSMEEEATTISCPRFVCLFASCYLVE